MTYLSLKSLGIPKNRIIGMGGALDSSRFQILSVSGFRLQCKMKLKVW